VLPLTPGAMRDRGRVGRRRPCPLVHQDLPGEGGAAAEKERRRGGERRSLADTSHVHGLPPFSPRQREPLGGSGTIRRSARADGVTSQPAIVLGRTPRRRMVTTG